MGHAGQPEHGERAEPEDLRADRDLAEPADQRQAPVCVSGWVVADTERGGEVRNVSLLVAIGVNEEGFREVLAVAEGSKEDKASWTAFLRHLKERGLKGVRLFVSDRCLGLVESLSEFYPEAL